MSTFTLSLVAIATVAALMLGVISLGFRLIGMFGKRGDANAEHSRASRS